MPRSLLLPQRWSNERLEEDRATAIDRFAARLMESGSVPYANWFAALRPIVESMLVKIEYGIDFKKGLGLLTKEEREGALRFCASPHLSEDNYKTLVNVLMARGPRSIEDAQYEVFLATVDPMRFPWLVEKRSPSAMERRIVVDWTASMWACQKAGTSSRMSSSKRQENVVRRFLDACGVEIDSGQGEVILTDDIPIGCYRAKETVVAGNKCDIPVRLLDGRLMLVECKVSNSTTNSTKRLIREVCGKASAWRERFGSQAVLAVVIDGVFSLSNLAEAQNDYGEYIFWEHNLAALGDFLEKLGFEPRDRRGEEVSI